MKKRQIIILLSAAVIVVGFFGLSQFLAQQKEEPEKKENPIVKKYVKTKSVEYSDIQTHVVAYGRVQSAQTMDLLSEVAGRMHQGQVALKPGTNFKKGTLLFYINDEEARLTLSSQKSNFLRDIAEVLPDVKVDFSTSFDTWSTYFSKIEVDKKLPSLPEVKSEKEKTFFATKGIYSTYYSIKSAEARLDKYRYYAPFDGSISEVSIQSGSFINPGTNIGKIIKSNALELQVAVETKDIAWIREGASTEVYSDETQQTWKGVVSRISDYVNQNTQSVDVYVKLTTSNQKIYDGQFMQAAIPASTIKDGMIIPRNILYNGNEVFILQDTLLKVKNVVVHRLMEDEAIISGLPANTDLISEPLVGAHNDMVVFKAKELEKIGESEAAFSSNVATSK